MNAQQLATELNKHDLSRGIPKSLIAQAIENDLVIVHGQSDDLVVLEGSICDQTDVYSGGEFYISKNGIVKNYCGGAKEIIAKWGMDTKQGIAADWLIESEIPHHQFKIMDGDHTFCIGIVFSINDI